MFSRRKIKNPGTTQLERGEIVEQTQLHESNLEAKKKELEERHVLFMEDGAQAYLKKMFTRIV